MNLFFWFFVFKEKKKGNHTGSRSAETRTNTSCSFIFSSVLFHHVMQQLGVPGRDSQAMSNTVVVGGLSMRSRAKLHHLEQDIKAAPGGFPFPGVTHTAPGSLGVEKIPGSVP